MTDPISPQAGPAAGAAGQPAFTPGPWAWFGNAVGVYLATEHSGRVIVMDFGRWGMRGAQPRFRERGVLIDATEMFKFQVGDPDVRGLEQAKANLTVYRLDIRDIDHPDARLIAAAPDLAVDGEFLLARLAELEIPEELARDWHGHVAPAIARFRAALTKALGPAASAVSTKEVPHD